MCSNCFGRQKRKQFFFEKKNQKTFFPAVADLSGSERQVAKVFWFFFSKKNYFPTLNVTTVPVPTSLSMPTVAPIRPTND